MNVENRLDLATMVQMQTVNSQEESLESRTGSRPPLHCQRIVINPETERAGIRKCEDITMALMKKL